jgi:DNA replication protein DnaC
MASINRELIARLETEGANSRDIAYAGANIPEEFWNITREGITVTPNNSFVYKFVTNYVDNIHNKIANGEGLSLLGAAKSGKTLFCCAILKSIALNPDTLRRDYRIIRANYDTIIEDFIHTRSDQDTYTELRNYLTRADILFLDSITYTTPPSVILSIMRTRRDYKKATLLATSLEPKNLIQCKSKEIFDIFDDVNKQYLLEKFSGHGAK